MSKPWFEQWFNTKYYHILYKNRDYKEAELFIDNLYNKLNLSNEFVCDLACGKGRHSIYLNKKGLKVLGLDLAANSINEAKKDAKQGLDFDTHDMRDSYPDVEFDLVFNLFTSFGYFDSQDENLKVLNAVNTMLGSEGRVVIDFFNAYKVIADLVEYEEKEIDGIKFCISKSYDGEHIFKNIKFEADGQIHDFTEKVQALKFDDFSRLLTDAGFVVENCFGDINLNPFSKEKSDRLIIVAKKK